MESEETPKLNLTRVSPMDQSRLDLQTNVPLVWPSSLITRLLQTSYQHFSLIDHDNNSPFIYKSLLPFINSTGNEHVPRILRNCLPYPDGNASNDVLTR